MQKSDNLKLQAENEQLRAELLKVTTKLDCALENNTTLSAQMKDLQEKLDIIINQFNKQKKKQHTSKNEHHNPREAPASTGTSSADSAETRQANGGAAAAPVKKSSRLT
jgi:soluble cytochrome b562